MNKTGLKTKRDRVLSYTVELMYFTFKVWCVVQLCALYFQSVTGYYGEGVTGTLRAMKLTLYFGAVFVSLFVLGAATSSLIKLFGNEARYAKEKADSVLNDLETLRKDKEGKGGDHGSN